MEEKIKNLFNDYVYNLLTYLENAKVSENERFLLKRLTWNLHDQVKEIMKDEVDRKDQR